MRPHDCTSAVTIAALSLHFIPYFIYYTHFNFWIRRFVFRFIVAIVVISIRLFVPKCMLDGGVWHTCAQTERHANYMAITYLYFTYIDFELRWDFNQINLIYFVYADAYRLDEMVFSSWVSVNSEHTLFFPCHANINDYTTPFFPMVFNIVCRCSDISLDSQKKKSK